MLGMFFTGLAGLNVARTALATTAHNTANVYTPGYSRQSAVVAANDALATGAGFIGTGARVTTVARSYDRYLTAQLTQAQSAAQALDTYATQIGNLDNLLADRTSGLAPLMQSFFTAVQGVANTPADPAARQQMISSAQALSGKFGSLDGYLTDLNGSLNEQIDGSVRQINAFASEIAGLNRQIGHLSALAGGQPPNDLLDQRDQLVNSLSKIVGVHVVEQDGGQYNLFVGTGQSLVIGDRATTVKAVASAADPTRTAVALAGPGGNTIELDDRVLTGGALGGVLAFRAQSLTGAQNAIGRIAMTLGSAFNAQHGLGVDLAGVPGKDFFSVASPAFFANAGNSGHPDLNASVLDASKLTTSDYAVDVKDVAGTLTYFVTRLSDGEDIPVTPVSDASGVHLSFDGVALSLGGPDPAQAGDSFLIQPTRNGGRDLAVMIGDPAKIAAASPLITGNGSSNKGSGRLGPARVDADYLAAPLAGPLTLTYDAAAKTLSGTVVQPDGTSASYPAGAVPYVDGAPFTFGGITLTLTGSPADGDTFTIDRNLSGVSDGSNALLLGALQRKTVVADGAATLNGAYAQLVSDVGNRTMQVQVAFAAQTSLAGQVRASQQSISGVNQDEETANLLMFQQMYQANAKVIQTASVMFDTILDIR